MLSKRKTIADHMIDVLNKYQEIEVDIGRPWLWVECYTNAGMKSSDNIFRNGVRVMNALERSGYFEKGYTRYRGKTRTFTLKEEYRREEI